MNNLSDFTGLYPVSKTLRFELKPIGKTKENIEKNGILERDGKRAVGYKALKKVIDEYHKAFIEQMLSNFSLAFENNNKKDSLSEFFYLYHLPTNDETRKKDFPTVEANLRKQISERFTKSTQYKRLFGMELIREDLSEFVTTPHYKSIILQQPGNEKLNDKEIDAIIEEVKQTIDQFYDFTTYFQGFYENRKNMYVADEQSTAIAYRMINENLPKFIDNISAFEKVAASEVAGNFRQLYSVMECYLNVNELAELFQLDYFTNVLTQSQIDVYNAIIGGRTLDDGTKIQGLNEYINLFNQQQTDKGKRLPKLRPLFKQILSDRNAISWLPDSFDSDNEMLEAIERCYQDLKEHVLEGERSLKMLLGSLNDYDLKHIYLPNDLLLTNIAQKLTGSWSTFNQALTERLKEENPKKNNETNEKYDERISKLANCYESFSIADLNDLLKDGQRIEDYFAKMGACDNENGQTLNHFLRIANAYTDAKELLNTPYPERKKLSQDKTNVAKVKCLLDAIKELQNYVKPLLGKGNENEKDSRFYGDFTPLWEQLDQITGLYNMVRNRMTQKPYSDEKIKLNFDNSTLLAGWDLNKEADNTCTILHKDGLFYLVIMDKRYNRVLKADYLTDEGECYEKMEYKLLPGANKMLPKVFFAASRQADFNPSKRILDIREKVSFKKGSSFNQEDCHEFIDFFKESIEKHEDWSKFGFKFSDTSSYEDISGFYREVEQQGYMLSFRKVSKKYIDALVEDGKIYLFQIYNKDFSPFSKGTPNMHTLYWKMLFDERNLANVVYKLNGQAEVFFRKTSINEEDTIKHLANQPIDNKNNLNNKKQSIFEYDLIKDRRYTVDKFQFHVPITMNFKAVGRDYINPQVNDFIKQGGIKHIIGIDRGERHLLYLSVIDLKGNIVEQYSLNEIVNEYNGKTFRTNYRDLLEKREDDRLKERQSWQTIENIKELKEGYLSQVIHKIAQLMIKYSAIVVLEDLNKGFMRGRQKVERQVYQKFEKMLIDKLNYLVEKQCNPEEAGGILKAYQLTNKFDRFMKHSKQSGFLFYIPAWNTSKMDPTTGFVNLFDTRYENRDKAKAFFGKFDSIRYNAKKGWFEFAFDYNNFTTKAEGTRTEWTLCTYGTRIETTRDPKQNNQFVSNEVNLTEAFKEYFGMWNISENGNLKEQICTVDNAEFFKGLLHLIHLMLQMRNSMTGTDIDYLLSPVQNDGGVFYDSRNCGSTLPENADANGAYNIARKGLWVVEQIKQADNYNKLNLAISNKEWMGYAQEKPYLK